MRESKYGYTTEMPDRLRQGQAEALQREIKKQQNVAGYAGMSAEYDSAVVRAGFALGWVKAEEGKPLDTDAMWPYEVQWIAAQIGHVFSESYTVSGE